MECRVTDEYITGDHTVFVAEPAFVYLDENVLTDGKFSDKYRSKDNQIHFADIIEMWNMW
jgi:flavin reductase (DIM6/NTAB) family NADH-FMN oxidoreductase RutF